MSENLEVGNIVTGKVTGIKPFGAFVSIDNEREGLVHISEVAHQYVKDVKEFLSVGDEVSVKILKIEEDSGKISLSIKATKPQPQTQQAPKPSAKPKAQKQPSSNNQNRGFNTLEDKLKDWLKESNEKHEQLNKRLKK